MKAGRTRLGYNAERVVGLDTGAIVAAEIYSADKAETASLRASLEAARTNGETTRGKSLRDDGGNAPPTAGASGEHSRPTIEVVADKGYENAELLLKLGRTEHRTHIPVPAHTGQRTVSGKWGMLAREAFHDNRRRVGRAKGKRHLQRRGKSIDPTFAPAWHTGAHRRVRMLGKENMNKRQVAHIAPLNVGLVMRAVFGHGTPRQAAGAVVFSTLTALRAWGGTAAVSLGRTLGTILPPPPQRPLSTCGQPAFLQRAARTSTQVPHR